MNSRLSMGRRRFTGLFSNAAISMLLIGASVTCVNAYAQSSPPPAMPPPVVGAVTKLEGQALTLKSPQGQEISLTLADNVRIIENQKVNFADVKPDSFIGVTAVTQSDGQLHAREIHIFPEAMRGTGEGHYPMAGPATTMTNGKVAALSRSQRTMTNGNVKSDSKEPGAVPTLKVAYQGGESEIRVGPEVPVTLLVVRDRSLLKPGTPVTVFAQKDASGKLMAQMIAVGGPGNAPPK